MKEKLVVIGNGMAPGRALERLFEKAPDRYEVTIFNAEPRVNYDRIMLSPILSGEKSFEDIVIHGDGWYVEKGVNLYKGHKVIGVDRVGAMLDEFLEAAARAGVARRTVHGAWPDVLPSTPPADVAICHHVLFDVADVVPFVVGLTVSARLAVVVEVPIRHPMSAWNEAFEHFWGLRRPTGPEHVDLVAVVRELGLDPEYAVAARRPLSRFAADPANLVPVARRRLCLSPDRDAELAAWLADHPPAFVDQVATLRWPGAADEPVQPIA